MVFGELDEDVGVGGAYGGGGGVGEVVAGVGKPDVVDDGGDFFFGYFATDGVVDVVAEGGGFFDTCAGSGADVDLEGAGVDGGEEVLAEKGSEAGDRDDADEQEDDDESSRVVNGEGEQADVAAAGFFEVVFEAALEGDEGIAAGLTLGGVFVAVFLEQVLGHGGNDGSGEQVAGEHGEDDGFSEGHEEVARDPAEEEHGHEDDADGEGGNESGDGDLGGAVEDGLLDFLAGFEIAVDVFDFNGGVVDEDADGEGEAARVMMLMVSPRAERMMSELRMESGMETAMMMVERQLPRKMRIMAPVRQAAMRASRTTPLMAPRTKMD